MISYVADMTSIDSCDAEIDCWETIWFSSLKGDDLPDTIETTLQHTMIAMYRNIFAVLTLLGVIPVTTCSCERCISAVLTHLGVIPVTTCSCERCISAVLTHLGVIPVTTCSCERCISAVLTHLGVIPVTTCSCERCISFLRRLKTYLRSTMSQVVLMI